MILFISATIDGNDITKPYEGRKYGLKTIASICQNLNIDSTNEILSHLSVGNERDGREIVLKSIEFYNIQGVRASTKNNNFNALVHSVLMFKNRQNTHIMQKNIMADH